MSSNDSDLTVRVLTPPETARRYPHLVNQLRMSVRRWGGPGGPWGWTCPTCDSTRRNGGWRHLRAINDAMLHRQHCTGRAAD